MLSERRSFSDFARNGVRTGRNARIDKAAGFLRLDFKQLASFMAVFADPMGADQLNDDLFLSQYGLLGS
jgi:hypothetical protein